MDNSRDSVAALSTCRRRSQPCRKPQSELFTLLRFLPFLSAAKPRTPLKACLGKDSNLARHTVSESRVPTKRRSERRRVSPLSGSWPAFDSALHGSPSVFPKKLRIRIFPATRVIPVEDAAPSQGERSPSPKNPAFDPSRPRPRLVLQENSDDEESLSPAIVKGLQTDSLTMSTNRENARGALELKPCDSKDENGHTRSLQGTRKSSRVPKRLVMDDDKEEMVRKHCRIGISKESAKGLYQYEEDGEMAQKEALLTVRQKSLESTKEGMLSPIEFPQGLPPVTRKKNNTLTEAEQKKKKEEAAQRRRIQVEKAEKELQDRTIRKILTQNSSRKKQEIKLRKQREEREKEKNAAAINPPKNSMHLHRGPSGTILSFSKDMDLSIFSGPLSYPKEREKCAGPGCNNTYKYRDSKSNLPLCSLECYRAVRNLAGITPAC